MSIPDPLGSALCKGNGGSDYACASKCLPTTSAKAQSLVADTIDCGESATPGSPACKQTYIACAQPDGASDCADAWVCADQCNKGKDSDVDGFSCALACMHAASPVSAAAFMDVLACAVWTPAGGCMDELLTCAAPSGTGTCAALAKCNEGCTGGDESANAKCLFGCLGAASKPAATKWLGAVQCWEGCKKSCGTKGKACVDTCAASKCQASLLSCVNS